MLSVSAYDYLVTPASTGEVQVFENIVGTNPFVYEIKNLRSNVEYFARVTAYNALGYGQSSALASGVPQATLGPPQRVTVASVSSTELRVAWAPPAGASAAAQASSYLIEWLDFDSDSSPEVQVVCVSATGGLVETQRVRVAAEALGCASRACVESSETHESADRPRPR